jgi:hypothetical protein
MVVTVIFMLLLRWSSIEPAFQVMILHSKWLIIKACLNIVIKNEKEVKHENEIKTSLICI